MSKRSQQLLMLVPSVLIGVCVPVAALYAMLVSLNDIVGTIIIVLSLLIAGVLGVVGMGISTALPSLDSGGDETAKTLRASQRAMLEEMDELVDLLGQIRDTLKNTGDGNE